MSNFLYVVNAPSVVSETIDGEVIIMNLKTGNYYSSDKVGAVVWGWIEAGKSTSEIAKLALERYDVSAAALETALAAFFERLVTEELVRETPMANGVAVLAGNSGHERFIAPELNAYTDMQDLLLLDPIHDVDEVGWPKPKEAENT